MDQTGVGERAGVWPAKATVDRVKRGGPADAFVHLTRGADPEVGEDPVDHRRLGDERDEPRQTRMSITREREATDPRACPRGPNVPRGLDGAAQCVWDGAKEGYGSCRRREPRGDAAE